MNFANLVRYKKPTSILEIVREKLAVRSIIRAYRAHRLLLIDDNRISSWKQQHNPLLVPKMSSNNGSELVLEEPQDIKPGKISSENKEERKILWNMAADPPVTAKVSQSMLTEAEKKIKTFFRKQRSRTMREDELEPVK